MAKKNEGQSVLVRFTQMTTQDGNFMCKRLERLTASPPSLPRPWRIATVATVHLLQFLKCVARGIGRYHFYRAIVWAHHLRTLAPSRFDALSAPTPHRLERFNAFSASTP